MIRLSVWLRFPDGNRLIAGELAAADPDPRRGGSLRGEFRYAPAYLDDPRAFALDPIHLTLQRGIFEANRPAAGVPAVFEDSLPDDWGRKLLARRYRMTRAEQRVPEYLRRVGMHGMGALGYSDAPANARKKPAFVSVEAHLPDLPALMAAADRVERGAPLHPVDAKRQEDLEHSEDLQLLFRAGSSPGGGRPKALIVDQGVHWLAKFPHHQDPVDMVRVEAASLALARQAGLEVPDFQVVELGQTAALLVQRFDVPYLGRLSSAAGSKHSTRKTPPAVDGRYHLVSLATLLGAENYYQFGYEDIADVLRELSSRPEVDLPALYRLTVFNAVLGNTDDHLKNFAVLHGDDGWRLAPVYDLLPDVAARREHVLHFGLSGNYPDVEALQALGDRVGLSARAAARIRDEVNGAVANWQAAFQEAGVPAPDAERLGPAIMERLARCAAPAATPDSGTDLGPTLG